MIGLESIAWLKQRTAGAPARILHWTPTDPNVGVDAQDIPACAWCFPSTEVLTHRWPTSRLAPMAKDVEGTCDLILFGAIGPEVNALASLEVVRNHLAPRGMARIEFVDPPSPARLPHWRDFWRAIGERLGLTVVGGHAGDAIVFERAETAPRWNIALARPEHYPQIADLFRSAFGHDLDPRLWQWKYGDGRGCGVVAFRAGQLVAHYGGLYRDIEIQGRPDWAMQVADVMVHPSQRGVWSRQGAFFLVTTTWGEMYGPLDFGFPNRRNMGLGARLGLYESAGRIVELRWPPATRRSPRWKTRLSVINRPDDIDPREFDDLCRESAKGRTAYVAGVRNLAWLAYRYMHHPTHTYEVFALRARLGGALLGVFVLRRQADSCELIDVIGRMRHVPELIDQARRISAKLQLGGLFTWCAEACAHQFDATQPQQHDLDVDIPTDSWTASPRAKELIDRWYLLSGDSDFR